MKQLNSTRRGFLFFLFGLPLLSFKAWAAKKTVKTTEAEASAALVKETEPMPQALKYSSDAAKATAHTNKKSTCANCLQYSQAVDASGKDIKVAGSLVGGCALFNGGKGYVKAGGWCMSWFEAPAS